LCLTLVRAHRRAVHGELAGGTSVDACSNQWLLHAMVRSGCERTVNPGPDVDARAAACGMTSVAAAQHRQRQEHGDTPLVVPHAQHAQA
jgi:hypothetical protein